MFSWFNKLSLIFFVALMLFGTPPLVWGQNEAEVPKEIRAINNRCSGNVVAGLCVPITADSSSFLSKGWETVRNLFLGVSRQFNLNQAASSAINTDQGVIPIKNETADAPSTFKSTLCGEGNAGVYSMGLPEFSDSKLAEVPDCEKGFDQAQFPEEVNVVIP